MSPHATDSSSQHNRTNIFQVLSKATEYIRHLEKRNKTMQDEMEALKAKLASAEAVFTKTRSRQGSIASPPSGTVRPRELTSNAAPMHSFLNVPQQGQYQQQYMSQQTSPTYARPPNAPVEAQNTPVRNGRGGVANREFNKVAAGKGPCGSRTWSTRLPNMGQLRRVLGRWLMSSRIPVR